MFIVWRDSMYYLSELDHIYCITNTKEEAIKYIGDRLDTETLPYIENGYLEFDRSHYGEHHYLSEIPLECENLFVLQCVGYDGHVQIFFDDEPSSIQRELQLWRNNSIKFKYDNVFHIHFAEMPDGSRYDIYELSISIHDNTDNSNNHKENNT
jgi:hypothetical protein